MSPCVTRRSAAAIYILPPTVSEATIQIGSEMTVGEMRIASEKPPHPGVRFRAFLNRTPSSLIAVATSVGPTSISYGVHMHLM